MLLSHSLSLSVAGGTATAHRLMLLVEEVDNKDFLTGLFDVMYDELPTPKPKKKK